MKHDPNLLTRESLVLGDLEFSGKPITMRPDGDREIRMLVDVYAKRDQYSHLATINLSVDEWHAFCRIREDLAEALRIASAANNDPGALEDHQARNARIEELRREWKIG